MSEEANNGENTHKEQSKIRARLARDGMYFCSVDTDDVRVWENIEDIEQKFYNEDEGHRVTDSLFPEQIRDASAPVIGTVVHTQGEIVDIQIDLSDWYNNTGGQTEN